MTNSYKVHGMKNFSRVIQRILNEKGMSQMQLASLSGMQQSKVSRLCKGDNRVDKDDITALLSAFPDASDRFQIVQAHIQDEVPLDGLKISRESGEEILKESFADLSSLSEPGESALSYLLELLREVPSIQDVFIDLARAFGWQEKTTPKGTKIVPKKVTTYGAPTSKRKTKKPQADAGRIGED